MKSAIRAIATIAAFSVGLPACTHEISSPEITATPSIDLPTFQSCVDREAKAAFQRYHTEVGAIYGYATDVENEVIAICDPHLMPETVLNSAYSSNPKYKYLNSAVEALAQSARNDKADAEVAAERKKAELDAPRLKAEKDEEEAALDAYYKCLVRHAKILALNSNEPAETIARASLPSCFEGRQTALEVYRRHKAYFSADKGFEQGLLLEIIRARAQPSGAPSSSVSPESPI
jgi:hypothetical protein